MYLVFDLDDTLLTSDKKITKYTKQILKKCQDRGHTIVINSARSHKFMDDITDEINADYVIANGGSEIYSNHMICYHKFLQLSDHKGLLESLHNDSIKRITIQTCDDLFTNDIEYAKNNKFAQYVDFEKFIPDMVSKIVVECYDEEFLKGIAKKYDLILTKYLNGNWYRLSVTNKQSGNEALLNLLAKGNMLDPNPTVYAFGDDIGDLEMLQKNNGVALKNAQPIVLESIKEVTEYTNNEDGVARYLENLLEKGIL